MRTRADAPWGRLMAHASQRRGRCMVACTKYADLCPRDDTIDIGAFLLGEL
jgi:hypothetical protein